MRVGSLRVISAGRISPDPGWSMVSHSHRNHELIVILRGVMRVTGNGLEQDCREGDVLLYPAGVAHAERADPRDPVESIFLAFLAPGLESRVLLCRPDRRGRVREMARWLYQDRLADTPASRVARDTLCRAMLAEMDATADAGVDTLVDETRAWVLAHLTERLTLERLATRAGLSRFHFLRRYQASAGRTPMQDVRAIRIDHARSLLLGTTLTLKQIAPLSGLGNEYSLSRAFRAHLGASPRSLRHFHERRSRSR